MNRFAHFITFHMSNKETFTLARAQAEALIDSAAQIVKVTHPDGEWTGEIINKAHIVDTKPNWNRQNEEQEAEVRRLETARDAAIESRDPAKVESIQNARKTLFLARPYPVKITGSDLSTGGVA